MAYVTIELINPPPGTNQWNMAIADASLTTLLDWGSGLHRGLSAFASFSIPASWVAPYYLYGIQIANETRDACGLYSRIVIYSLVRPVPPILIPGPGDYYFNALTRQIVTKAVPWVERATIDVQNLSMSAQLPAPVTFSIYTSIKVDGVEWAGPEWSGPWTITESFLALQLRRWVVDISLPAAYKGHQMAVEVKVSAAASGELVMSKIQPRTL